MSSLTTSYPILHWTTFLPRVNWSSTHKSLSLNFPPTRCGLIGECLKLKVKVTWNFPRQRQNVWNLKNFQGIAHIVSCLLLRCQKLWKQHRMPREWEEKSIFYLKLRCCSHMGPYMKIITVRKFKIQLALCGCIEKLFLVVSLSLVHFVALAKTH